MESEFAAQMCVVDTLKMLSKQLRKQADILEKSGEDYCRTRAEERRLVAQELLTVANSL